MRSKTDFKHSGVESGDSLTESIQKVVNTAKTAVETPNDGNRRAFRGIDIDPKGFDVEGLLVVTYLKIYMISIGMEN